MKLKLQYNSSRCKISVQSVSLLVSSFPLALAVFGYYRCQLRSKNKGGGTPTPKKSWPLSRQNLANYQRGRILCWLFTITRGNSWLAANRILINTQYSSSDSCLSNKFSMLQSGIGPLGVKQGGVIFERKKYSASCAKLFQDNNSKISLFTVAFVSVAKHFDSSSTIRKTLNFAPSVTSELPPPPPLSRGTLYSTVYTVSEKFGDFC